MFNFNYLDTNLTGTIMKIIDLDKKNHSLYFICLEDWSDEMKESGDHKQKWFEKMKDQGLRVKLAVDDNGVVGGMIQYVPIEHSVVEGKELYFINCIWVHGHMQGRGDFRKKGMGTSLLQAAENDAKLSGAKGIAAWGLRLPVWMRASWFKKHGYSTVDKMGMQALVWKPFAADAEPPKWIHQKEKPKKEQGKVTVTGYINGWCPAMNIGFERCKRAALDEAFKSKVVFREINTFDKKTIMKLGMSDALFIDEKEIRNGPPPSYEKIHRFIAKQVNKL